MAEHAVGDTVYMDAGAFGKIVIGTGTVTKITPTGRINVASNQRKNWEGKSVVYQFDKNGRQIGASNWHHPIRLISEEEYLRLKPQADDARIRGTVSYIASEIRSNMSVDEMREKCERMLKILNEGVK